MNDRVTISTKLARRENKVLRPRDAGDVYAHPRSEFERLREQAVLSHISTGYYALAPMERLGDPRWRPDLTAVALGVAQADYGKDAVALMSVTAARRHGALLRTIGTAVVAAPKQRPVLRTNVGDVVFVKRDVRRLDLERVETELTAGWMTTPEQTALDVAARPELGGIEQAEAESILRALARKIDWTVTEELARDQHRPAALARVKEAAGV
ncbi:type IV toxin-antitoxin system AbiEi family antitoxin [Lentzea sp. BCCO 10_0061]|uniref:Type IV toxin-antitoxin system AbiEi family antitoxin n=1 Tax=Lentzea sokolovensis TaxID=3095429 RepID=A0ABU4V9B3_9PSEU|nr:type IV toxin-antitoxin system AbiEi family antitoxin [Lentzea sp. BCCO 10_0061]MDX8148371.1 type IV toxin-antitoxin system AbiEi family antitoxin [Lentzea sp. BCCO 10_0061]